MHSCLSSQHSQQEVPGESQKSGSRATVPAKRLAQTGSLKAGFLPLDTAAQPQNVCKKPIAGNCQWLNCITELIPPVPRPRPQDELGEANSPMEQPLERTSAPLVLCSGEIINCSIIPWGGFWVTYPQGATWNARAEESIAVSYSPHTTSCRKGHGTFPLCGRPLPLTPVLLQIGDYSLCFLVLSVVGSSIFVFFPSEITKLYCFSEIGRREDSDADGEYKHANRSLFCGCSFRTEFCLRVRAIQAPWCLEIV